MAHLTGKGAKFQWYVTSALTDVPNVETIKPHNSTLPVVRFKALNDTDDTVLGTGIHVAGQISVRMSYDPDNATHAAMLADKDAGTVRTAAVVYSNTGACTITYGEAVITGWDYQELTDTGLQMVQLTIDVSSAVTAP